MLKKYPETIRDDAVSAVEARRLRNPRDRTIFREVAEQFSVGEQSLRIWVRQRDQHLRRASEGLQEPIQADGLPVKSAEQLHAELVAMQRKIDKLQAENDVLKRAFVVFSAEWSK